MSWRYVVSREVLQGEEVFAIREDYEGYGYTVDEIAPSGYSREDLVWTLERMLEAAREGDVLDLS